MLHLREPVDPTAKLESLRELALCPGVAVPYEAAFHVTYPYVDWYSQTQSAVVQRTALGPLVWQTDLRVRMTSTCL
jgi:hypothetical protein